MLIEGRFSPASSRSIPGQINEKAALSPLK